MVAEGVVVVVVVVEVVWWWWWRYRDQLTMQSLGSRNGIHIKQDMNCLCYLRVQRRPFYSGLL